MDPEKAKQEERELLGELKPLLKQAADVIAALDDVARGGKFVEDDLAGVDEAAQSLEQESELINRLIDVQDGLAQWNDRQGFSTQDD